MSGEPCDYVYVALLQGPNATVAQVSYDCVTTSADAWRDRGDSADPDTGRLLATGRALVKLGQKLEKQAQAKINAAASIREHHAEIAARKAEALANAPDVTFLIQGISLHPSSGEVTFEYQVGAGGGGTDRDLSVGNEITYAVPPDDESA